MKRMLLTAALLTLSSVQAGGMDMAMPGMTHMTMPMTPSASVPGLSQMGLQMQLDMRMMMMPMISDLARLSGRSFERAFMSMMIPHHQGAIDSSRAVSAWICSPATMRPAPARRGRRSSPSTG